MVVSIPSLKGGEQKYYRQTGKYDSLKTKFGFTIDIFYLAANKRITFNRRACHWFQNMHYRSAKYN